MNNIRENDRELLHNLGKFVQKVRIEQNITQKELADAADLNRSTLSLFEKGNGTTLLTFLRILRVLGKLEILDAFDTSNKISPLLLAKMEQTQRQRARKSKKESDKPKSDW